MGPQRLARRPTCAARITPPSVPRGTTTPAPAVASLTACSQSSSESCAAVVRTILRCGAAHMAGATHPEPGPWSPPDCLPFPHMLFSLEPPWGVLYGRDSANRSAEGLGPKPARATQSIAPSVRRWVLRRDRGSCVLPGSSNASFLDVHHIRPQHCRHRRVLHMAPRTPTPSLRSLKAGALRTPRVFSGTRRTRRRRAACRGSIWRSAATAGPRKFRPS